MGSVILFQLDSCFRRKEFRFPLRSWAIKRIGKCDKKNRSSLEICSGARCAGHPTRRQSSWELRERERTSQSFRLPGPYARFPPEKYRQEPDPFVSRPRLVKTSAPHATHANVLQLSWPDPPKHVNDSPW